MIRWSYFLCSGVPTAESFRDKKEEQIKETLTEFFGQNPGIKELSLEVIDSKVRSLRTCPVSLASVAPESEIMKRVPEEIFKKGILVDIFLSESKVAVTCVLSVSGLDVNELRKLVRGPTSQMGLNPDLLILDRAMMFRDAERRLEVARRTESEKRKVVTDLAELLMKARIPLDEAESLRLAIERELKGLSLTAEELKRLPDVGNKVAMLIKDVTKVAS